MWEMRAKALAQVRWSLVDRQRPQMPQQGYLLVRLESVIPFGPVKNFQWALLTARIKPPDVRSEVDCTYLYACGSALVSPESSFGLTSKAGGH